MHYICLYVFMGAKCFQMCLVKAIIYVVTNHIDNVSS